MALTPINREARQQAKVKNAPDVEQTHEQESRDEAEEIRLALVASRDLSDKKAKAASMKAHAKRSVDAIAEQQDSGYWFSVFFSTNEQRDEFLTAVKAMGLLEDGQHINGRKFAELLGVALAGSRPLARPFKICPRLASLALPKQK